MLYDVLFFSFLYVFSLYSNISLCLGTLRSSFDMSTLRSVMGYILWVSLWKCVLCVRLWTWVLCNRLLTLFGILLSTTILSFGTLPKIGQVIWWWILFYEDGDWFGAYDCVQWQKTICLTKQWKNHSKLHFFPICHHLSFKFIYQSIFILKY